MISISNTDILSGTAQNSYYYVTYHHLLQQKRNLAAWYTFECQLHDN